MSSRPTVVLLGAHALREAHGSDSATHALSIQGDVSSKAEVAKVYDSVAALTDVVDVLINCAGIVRNHRGGSIADVNDIAKIQKALWDGHDDEDWQATSASELSRG